MAKYTQKGSRFLVGKDADAVVHDALPPGTYTVAYNEQFGFYLTTTSDFTLPPKVYGKSHRHAERMLQTFWQRPNSTGIHLDGVKGSGKTLLVKTICIEGQKQNIPTIIINEPYCGDDFNSFMQSIDTPCIVVFDEFEKTYDREKQTKILTLFDGVYPSKKMFLLTTNESWRVSDFLKNRPGRMYYSMKFDVIEKGVVEEYLRDNLKDKEQIPKIVKYSQVFTFLNFDMLTAVVEEMNRYDETLVEVLQILNVKPEMRQDELYTVKLSYDGGKFADIAEIQSYDPNDWEYYLGGGEIRRAMGVSEDTDDEPGYTKTLPGDTTSAKEINTSGISIYPDFLKGFDGAKGEFTYEYKRNGKAFIVKVVRQSLLGGSSSVFRFDAL